MNLKQNNKKKLCNKYIKGIYNFSYIIINYF